MEMLQLKYFLALAETEHVSRTAELLHISQPSLSATIRKLEEELGAPLFERTGRNIRLSPYGQAFLVYAKEAMLSLENGKTTVAQMKNKADRTISLGVLSPYVWSDLFDAFRRAHPEILVSRYSMEGGEYAAALKEGRIDLYLGGINRLSDPELTANTLYTDGMVLLVNRQNPLAALDEVDLRLCKKERFINLGRDTDLQRFVSTLFDAAGFTPNVIMEVDYTLRDEMVSLNYGISVTTARSAARTAFDNVKPVRIASPGLRRALGLVRLNSPVCKDAARVFMDFAADFYGRT